MNVQIDEAGAREQTQYQRRRRRATEFIATALLSLGGVATSWSTYQAALWSGIQAMHYSSANALRVEASRDFTAAGQIEGADIALFLGWVNAYAAHDEPLQRFYRGRFRREFEPAFEAWLAQKPMQNPQAARTPFVLDTYQLGRRGEAMELERKSEAEFLEGQTANDNSDNYVLNSVVLATVLFFAGISQQFRMFRVQLTLLGISTVLLLAGSFSLIALPKA